MINFMFKWWQRVRARKPYYAVLNIGDGMIVYVAKPLTDHDVDALTRLCNEFREGKANVLVLPEFCHVVIVSRPVLRAKLLEELDHENEEI